MHNKETLVEEKWHLTLISKEILHCTVATFCLSYLEILLLSNNNSTKNKKNVKWNQNAILYSIDTIDALEFQK